MIRAQFWGTRGSITSPGAANWHYGGHTACVELIGFDNDQPGAATRLHNAHIILDGGSGLASLQTALMNGPCGQGKGELHLLLSHYHWDHLIGLPFFRPMFVKGNHIAFYGASIEALQASIERLFTSDYSPVNGVQNVAAQLSYHLLDDGPTPVGGFEVETAPSNHPGVTLTFRIRYGPHTVIYTPDHEAGDSLADRQLVDLAQDAHLWILDAQYTPDEMAFHRAWGHSSHLEAAQLALEANAKIAALFHHDPDHDDKILDRMGHEAKSVVADSGTTLLMSRDGMVIDIEHSM